MHPTGMISLGLLLIILPLVRSSEIKRVEIDKNLEKYLGTLERYANTVNDVVFLLDESGSIGADKFPHVKLFAKLTAQRLSVSAEHSRIAVVTFATEPINHIDYIKNPYGNNMCSLLKEIDAIGYAAEWTHTDKAMKEAENILAQARPSANKIIVLLTDGQSNEGHSPVSIANVLKQRGIIIFAIGVADVNVAEINAVATSPDHIYILNNFDYIVEVNKYLVNDTKEISMDLAKDNSYCNALCNENNDCCDSHASCYCGTRTGRYECACNAGYHGKGGNRGQCHTCPKGTYKSESLNIECTACPLHSTTEREGSTSFSDCKCDTGYEKIGNYCAPVKCASLNAPLGGILIPTHCNNSFGTQCSLRCKEGYCPFSCNAHDALQNLNHQPPLPSRICLETREWSGQEFFCEKRTCPALRFPENGMHNCTENDFTFGTICSFHCNKGYELSGSKTRTCLFNSWTGDETICKGIFCDPLKTNSRLHVKRTPCSTEPMPYKSVCQYHCSDGYILVRNDNKTDGVLTCGDDKKWIGGYKDITCKDIEPPKIKCPKPIKIDAEYHKEYAQVQWDFPEATDNVPGNVTAVRIVQPQTLKKSILFSKNRPAYYFPVGRTKVVYEATDLAKLSSTCSFNVEVVDKEPPIVVFCPEDIEISHGTNDAIPVKWDEPVFEDNSKKLKSVDQTRKSGDHFGWGPATTVFYNATDESDNTASCSFKIKIKPYACPYYNPPANGVLTCDNWMDGTMCTVFCHDGFQFADRRKSEKTYICKKSVKKDGTIEGRWEAFRGRRDFKMPWPDCSRKQKPSSLNVTVDYKFGVDSCSAESLKKFREKFFNIEAFKNDFFCPKDKGCSPDNVNITCNPASARYKRSIRRDRLDSEDFIYKSKRDLPKQTLTISFNLLVLPTDSDEESSRKPVVETGDKTEVEESLSPLMKEMESELTQNVKDSYNVLNAVVPEVHYNVVAMCSVGQINVNNSCVNCPAGSYKDDVSETCMDCPIATYQDEERKLSCKACPVGFTTHEMKSKSKLDCKGPCQPGTHSRTTFEPCAACPLNTYQERAARKECLKCPAGLYTWRLGANASSDCAAPCKRGTFSDTGLEPCSLCETGTYQEEERQTNCSICPNRTTTKFRGAKHFEDCTEFDICAELQPCKYNSSCIQRDKDYECICPDGLQGRDCEINPDDCASSPCLNNATCIDGIGNFTCQCLDGWFGHRCQTNRDDCDPNPCLNNGKCLDKWNAYECECQPGFSGQRCERNIYECESQPCLNGGTCFDIQNGYRCCCPKDYYGQNCEKVLIVNICDTVTCRNGGTCSADSEVFSCICPFGFEGEFCEKNIDDCEDHKCMNDGVCVDGIGNSTCNCSPKYTGLQCEEALLHEYTLNFPTPSTTNYVELNNVRRLYAVTMAFFMRTSYKDPNSRATPVSYSYKYKYHLVDNAFTLFDTNNFVLYIHGQTIHTNFAGNSDSSWHHYAVTWEKLGGKWAFYVDGKIISNGNKVGEDKYMHPGTFVLGQEQDAVGSQFSVLEAFAGDITEFNVWEYALTEDEIRTISSSCGYMGSLIPWYTVSQYVSGDVKISTDVDLCKDIGPCEDDRCYCYHSKEKGYVPCKSEVPECTACNNNETCITIGEHLFCVCAEGFEGRHCEYDLDECLDRNGGCDDVCVNEVGSYHCECPSDMYLSEDGKRCNDTAYCLKDDQTYVLKGDKWVKDCQTCICDNGIVQCENVFCNKTSCLPEETLIINPGECCPKCVAWSFCVITPNSTIMSFDLSKYEIEGSCNYTAVEDCIGGRFKVEVEYSINRTYLVIYQDCSKMTISSYGDIYVDDDSMEIPFKNDLWNVKKSASSVSVNTDANLIVEWDFTGEAVIAVPITHRSKMCGLCNKIEEYYLYNSGKFPLSDRYATVRLLSSEINSFISV